MDEKCVDPDQCASSTLLSKCGIYWERSGSQVEYLTRDRGDAGSSLTGVIVLCP